MVDRVPLKGKTSAPAPVPADKPVGGPQAADKQAPVRKNTAPVLSTGATLLDEGLNGGWAFGRAVNIVGDTAAGKTLIAIEACANFALRFGVKDIRYNEAENAFNRDYAESIGLPPGVKFTGDDEEEEANRRGSRTVEEFEADFDKWLSPRVAKPRPCLYVLDSFDALEAAKELKRDFGDRQPGAKAALSSEFYRTHVANIHAAQCILMIVSQLRDAIGVMFGEQQVRSGGRAHDFFASQIVWLATSRKITGKVAGVDRTVGTHSIFNVKKNKIGKPHARAPLVIHYNYGIDDEMSNIEWLQENKLGAAGHLTIPIKEYAAAVTEVRQARDFDTLVKMREELATAVRIRWAEIDEAMAPPIAKYRSA